MTNERARSELEQLYMSLSEEKKKALDVAFKAMAQADEDCISRTAAIKALSKGEGCGNICANALRRLPSLAMPTQADGEKTCVTCRNEDTYHCAECENKSDYEQAQADGEITDDDIATMRILFNADIECLCNQGRMKDAKELEQIRDRLMARLQADGEYNSRQAVDELSRQLVHTTRDKADYLCNFWEELRKLQGVAIPTEHDGCKDCKHENKSDGEYPCSYCKQNYRDMWELEKPTDTITMTREEFNKVIMEHYRQGRADEKAYQNGEIMQSFNPD